MNGVPDSQGIVEPQTTGYDTFAGFIPETSGKGGGISLHADHNLGSVIIENITAWRRNKSFLNLDADGRPDNFFNTGQLVYQHLFTQELHLTNSPGSPIDWIAGIFYLERSTIESPKEPGIVYGGLAGAAQYQKTDADQVVQSFSPFAQATFPVFDKFKITGGLRWTNEKSHARQTTFTALGPLIFIPQKDSFKKFTWRLAADYAFTQDILAYVSYNRGIKSGGFNLGIVQYAPYKPEVVDAFEAGIKSEFFGRHIRLNVAAYHYDYKNIQIRAYPSAGAQLTYNAGEAKVDGIDVDAEFAITRDFTLSAAFTALKTKVVKFDGTALTYGASGGPQILFSPLGNKLPFAPPFSSSLTGTYGKDTSIGRVTGTASYSYSAKSYPDLYNGPGARKFPGHSLLNASVGWKAPDGRLGVDIWAKNLTKDYYLATLTTIFSGDLTVPAAPRTFDITFHSSF